MKQVQSWTEVFDNRRVLHAPWQDFSAFPLFASLPRKQDASLARNLKNLHPPSCKVVVLLRGGAGKAHAGLAFRLTDQRSQGNLEDQCCESDGKQVRLAWWSEHRAMLSADCKVAVSDKYIYTSLQLGTS